jgi:hypothetical protein
LYNTPCHKVWCGKYKYNDRTVVPHVIKIDVENTSTMTERCTPCHKVWCGKYKYKDRTVVSHVIKFDVFLFGLGLGLWCLKLMALSTIFQLNRDGKCCWWRKPEYLVKTYDWCTSIWRHVILETQLSHKYNWGVHFDYVNLEKYWDKKHVIYR